MNRRQLLGAAATTPLMTAFACRPGAAEAGSDARPRNVLLIVSDDQSRFDLGAYGNPACSTPNVDRLAAEGTRFTSAYTPVSLCMPARSCLYTGLYPHRNGATGFEPIRPDVKTWPMWLADTSLTGMVGKFNVKPKEQFPFEVFSRGGLIHKEGRSPDKYEQLFGEFLDQVGERRFAAVVNLKDPHRPFEEDRFLGELDPPPPDLAPEDAWVPGCLWDTPATRLELVHYYTALRRLDETVGRVLARLAAAGHADDTLVVFTSDNGMPFPFAKSTLYEPGINLPFVVRWPGVIAPGGESGAFVSLVDLLPTALDTFGLPAADLDGASLLPLLRGEVEAVRERVVGALDELLAGEPTPSRSIRDRRHKYIVNLRPEVEFSNNILIHSKTWASWEALAPKVPELAARIEHLLHRPAEELYDLEADPWELRNLAADPAAAAVRTRLRAELVAWLDRAGDSAGAALD